MRYLVNSPIDGVRIQAGQHEQVRLEAGSVFALSSKVPLNSRLIEAIWDGESILLFADDLDGKCERIRL